MTDDKMREAFEAREDVALDYSTYPDGMYMYEAARIAYADFRAGWQACAASQAQEIEALRAQVQDQALFRPAAPGVKAGDLYDESRYSIQA